MVVGPVDPDGRTRGKRPPNGWLLVGIYIGVTIPYGAALVYFNLWDTLLYALVIPILFMGAYYHRAYYLVMLTVLMAVSLGVTALVAPEPLYAFTTVAASVLAIAAVSEVLHAGRMRLHAAAQALQASEARYRQLVDCLEDTVWRITPGGNITYVSAAARTMFGYEPEQLVGDTVERLLAIDSLEPVRRYLNQMAESVAGAQGVRIELEHRRADESTFIGEIRSTPLLDNKGRYVGLQGITRDVTARRQAQERLRFREAILQAVADTSERFLSSHDWEDHVARALADLAQAAGVTHAYLYQVVCGAGDKPERACRLAFWRRADLEELPTFAKTADLPLDDAALQSWTASLRGGQLVYGVRSSYSGAAGDFMASMRVASIALVPVFVNGRWWGVLGFEECEDEREWTPAELGAIKAGASIIGAAIERGEIEKARKASEERFRSLLENLPVGVYRARANGEPGFVMGNSAAARMYGVDSIGDFLRSSVLSMYVDDQARKAFLAKLARQESVEQHELRLRRKDGQLRWVAITAQITHDAEGNPAFYDGIVEDITERKVAEQTIARQQLEILAASRMSALGMLAAGVSHEINNPLAVISMGVEHFRSLEARGQGTNEKREMIMQRIARNVDRIERIVSGLRNLSRDGSDDPFRAESAATVLDDAFELCRARFRARDIRLEEPEIEGDIEIECRRTQVSQVLMNLLNNAQDAVEPLAEKWIAVAFRQAEGYVDIRVSDSGRGLSESLAERIFQPFFTTKEVGRGTGLGLSISRAIAEDHHGALFLDREARYTTFVLRLPERQPAGETSPVRAHGGTEHP